MAVLDPTDEELRDALAADERELSVVISSATLPDLPIIHVSEEFERQTGYAADEVIGRNCRFMQGPETDPAAVELIRAGLKAQTTFTVDILNYRKDGSAFMNRLRIRPLFDDEGRATHFIGAQNPV